MCRFRAYVIDKERERVVSCNMFNYHDSHSFFPDKTWSFRSLYVSSVHFTRKIPGTSTLRRNHFVARHFVAIISSQDTSSHVHFVARSLRRKTLRRKTLRRKTIPSFH